MANVGQFVIVDVLMPAALAGMLAKTLAVTAERNLDAGQGKLFQRHAVEVNNETSLGFSSFTRGLSFWHATVRKLFCFARNTGRGASHRTQPAASY